MKVGIIATLIVAGSLTVAGSVVLGVAIANHSFENDGRFETHNVTLEDSFSKINIDTDISNITLKASDDDKCKVESIDSEKLVHEISVKDDELVIKQVNNYKWYETLFGSLKKVHVTVYLPLDNYSDVTLKSDTGEIVFDKALTVDKFNLESHTGDVVIKDLTASELKATTSTGDQGYKNVTVTNDININASTGDIALDTVTATNINVKTSTGKHYYREVVASDKLNIEADTGDVKLLNSDGGTVAIKTSTGDVSGNLLSDKTFQVHSSTGSVNVPPTSGPLCTINTSTGDIRITVGRV